MTTRFDSAAKALASGISRRNALKGAAAAVTGTALAFLSSTAQASPTREAAPGGPCKQGNKVQCGDKCCDRRSQFCCQAGGQAICCPSDAVACDILGGLITCLSVPGTA